MNVAIRQPVMTREEFFVWAEAQEERYEFDGFAPVGMTGGTIGHSRICHNLYAALRTRLRGSSCEPFGPDAGVATGGDGVRYPDAVITCTRTADDARVVDSPVVIFEVVSPSSGYVDRIIKVREYQIVPSVRRYIILEHTVIGASVLHRATGDEPWTVSTLTSVDVLQIPEVGLEIPMQDLYRSLDFTLAGSLETPITDA